MQRPRLTRVLVVDANSAFAGIVAELLDDEPGFAVAATALSGRHAVQLARELELDVVLLDERVDGSVSPAIVQALRAAAPRAVLIVWSHHELHTAVAGADCVLERGITFRELVRSVRACLRDKRTIDLRDGVRQEAEPA